MKFTLGIKPTIFTGYGTTNDALARFRQSFFGCGCCSNRFGSGYVNSICPNCCTHVYAYNIEVFKRGKHRKNKHYVIYRYSFPIEMFNLLNVEIHQGHRTFTIKPKK